MLHMWGTITIPIAVHVYMADWQNLISACRIRLCIGYFCVH